MQSRRGLTEPSPGIAVRVATAGPVGRFPVAPGTAGAAVGIGIIAVLHRVTPGPKSFCGAAAAAAVAIYIVGVWAAGRAEKAFGFPDPGYVVIDEVAGQCLSFVFQGAGGWAWLLAGFILFRIFDVLKPFPARRFERLPGGWGIMTDDMAAGLYAAVALFLLGIAFR